MADMNDFSNINENFDTIKTLLNSIRAQGILNTSDIDKLLGGINSKLEKINTEEDIDLIKAFLSELKHNLDERHNVLISKFGAIESLFSNLLKNSTESVKTSEIKELFDIVATNLSVFSREVVSQKETLSDITLRIDAMRSDDTLKKDIIKSIGTVRSDVDKVSNGFDSIVISLNENFKTVLKTISEIDQSEAIKGFTDQLNDIITSVNTVLSAIQLIDKKNSQWEDSLDDIARREDTTNIQRSILELTAKSKEISDFVEVLTQKSYKIDNLSDKIDAAVNIIVGLKSELEEKDADSKETVLNKLSELENCVKDVSTSTEFETFREYFGNALSEISKNSTSFKEILDNALTGVGELSQDLKSLNINLNFQNISDGIDKLLTGMDKLNEGMDLIDPELNNKKIATNMMSVGEDIKEKVASEADKLSQLLDINITRTLNDISTNAEVLNSRMKDASSTLAGLCEKNFAEVSECISGLKDTITQLDENNISANNAIFSNMTDRLAVFENSLKSSLEKQEDFVSSSSSTLVEQIKNLKTVTDDLDFKLDSSSIEISNSKREFEELKDSINNVLALDFVKTVKDFKVELYAVKQDLETAMESSDSELSEKFSNDLFGKYELVVSKLDSLEDEIKSVQKESLDSLNSVLAKISSSIIDVLSYVSVNKESNNESIESALKKVADNVQYSNLNYVENVRDIVDVIRIQVENNLKQISEESDSKFNKITEAIAESNYTLKQDIKKSYDKLQEVNEIFDSIKEDMNVNSVTMSTNVSTILSSAEKLKEDFDFKLNTFKNTLLEKVTEFKNEFSCENADKLSELKFNAENLHSRAVKQSIDLKNELKSELDGIISALRLNISNLNEHLSSVALQIENTNKDIVDYVKNDFTTDINDSVDSIKTKTTDVLSEIDLRVSDVVGGFNSLETSVNSLSKEMTTSFSGILGKILENFSAIQSLINTANEKTLDQSSQFSDGIKHDFDELKERFEDGNHIIDRHLEHQTGIMTDNYENLENLIKILDEQASENFATAIDELKIEFDILKRKFVEIDKAVDDDLSRQVSIIEGNFESLNLMLVDIINQGTEALSDKIKKELNGASSLMSETLAGELEQYKVQIEELFTELKGESSNQTEFLNKKVIELNNILESTLEKQNRSSAMQLSNIAEDLKDTIAKNLEISSADYSVLKEKLLEYYNNISENNNVLVNDIRSQLDDVIKYLDSNIELQTQDVISKFNQITSIITNLEEANKEFNLSSKERIQKIESSIYELREKGTVASDERAERIIATLTNIVRELSDNEFENIQNITDIKYNELSLLLQTSSDAVKSEFEEQASKILNNIRQLREEQQEHNEHIKQVFNDEIRLEISGLKDRIQSMFEENSMNFLAQLGNCNTKFSEEVASNMVEIQAEFARLNSKIDDVTLSRTDILKAQIDEIETSFKTLTESLLDSKIDKLVTINADISAGELKTIEEYADKILDQAENIKQNSIVCKDLISGLIEEQFKLISKDIEKETDVIVGDIIEQFGILKDGQKDELTNLTAAIEGSVAGYIIDAVNDLKSYFDIKNDQSVLNCELDTLRSELESSFESTAENINKLLEVSVFTETITDLRATNEVLIKSTSDKLNSQIQNFIKTNISDKFEEKLNIFDKKFIDTVVDKYEEIKVLTGQYNSLFTKLSESLSELVSNFVESKNEINQNITTLVGNINNSVKDLQNSFSELKAQILNKSFDEAFHESVHNQISGIENLVHEQMGYLEDISELCCTNLPELTEMNTIVKHSIQQLLLDLKTKVDNQDIDIKDALNGLKSDIITQFINVFNQVSFVAEQEEIIDFIQEKHNELITILSHIVTSADEVDAVKNSISLVDNKVDLIKEDINIINEKITAIMSSEGDIDYVYSLQDLESDIANLRLVLNGMKSEDFAELTNSINNVCELVQAIKTELPRFEAEEFKKDFENLTEDILSISTRTNKLLLASDESHKTLQDNLQEFKLVINDLDERTRNFSKEAGIDKIDNKLAQINTMMQNGAKTNQVFNQVFEYLAEWVDKAGIQISQISDKVETLDSIGQIKVMLEDLRAESQDNSESVELVEALSSVFEKQSKRIASLEAKIDRMIVDSTINSRSNKIDIEPIENTLNSFLVAIDDKMLSQQRKIQSLETKLEEMVSLVDNKDTAQLSKKVGGMDRQLAKLNKSIEKIASNVVEK